MRKLVILIIFISVLPLLAFEQGDRILGKWSDGLWYPGEITGLVDEKFIVSFDDGDMSILASKDIRVIDWKEGSRIECNWKLRGVYYSGIISEKSNDQIHVDYDDGDKELTVIGRCRSK